MFKIKYIFILLISLVSWSAFSKNPPQNIAKMLTHDKKERFDYYFFEAMKQRDLRQFDAEMEALRMCLNIDSTNGTAQSEIGELYMRLENLPAATSSFRKAVKYSPENWWYRSQLISLLSSQDKTSDAISHALELKKRFPQKEEVYTMLSSLYKQSGDYDKAVDALNQLEVYSGINEYLSFQKYQLYTALKKDKKAMNEIDRLITKFPTETRYQVLKGDIFLQQKKYQDALNMYNKILESDPTNPLVYVSLSNYYNAKDQPEKAMDAIVSALKNPKLPSDIKMEILGQYLQKLLINNEKITETENLFKILVEQYPLDDKVHTYYALFLQHQKRYDEAMAEMESVININPKNEQAWITQINIMGQKEDTLGILKVTERALKFVPHVPQIYVFRAMAQYQQGKYDDALKTNQEALKNIDTDIPQIAATFYGQMADIYYKLNDKKNAFISYDKALENDPTNIYVMNNYAYYLSEEKTDLRKAERMSAKTVEAEPKNSTYLDTYAWILYQQENFSLAKFYIERAVDNLEKEHEPGVIYEHYGDIMYALKDYEKALEMWSKAYESGKMDKELWAKIEKIMKDHNLKLPEPQKTENEKK